MPEDAVFLPPSRFPRPKIKARKIQAVPDGKNLCPLIKPELKLFFKKILRHLLNAQKKLPVMMNRHAVIRVTEVVFYPKPFPDKHVKTVRIVNGKPLADLFFHGKLLSGAGLVAVNNAPEEAEHSLIGKYPLELCLQEVVIHGIKVLSDIAPEKIPPVSVMEVIVRQKTGQSFKRKRKPLSDSAGGIVINQPFIKVRGQNLIAKTVLYHPVGIMQCGNVPLPEFVHKETAIPGHPAALLFRIARDREVRFRARSFSKRISSFRRLLERRVLRCAQ